MVAPSWLYSCGYSVEFFGALHLIGFITRSSLQHATAARMQYCGSSQIILYSLIKSGAESSSVCVCVIALSADS